MLTGSSILSGCAGANRTANFSARTLNIGSRHRKKQLNQLGRASVAGEVLLDKTAIRITQATIDNSDNRSRDTTRIGFVDGPYGVGQSLIGLCRILPRNPLCANSALLTVVTSISFPSHIRHRASTTFCFAAATSLKSCPPLYTSRVLKKAVFCSGQVADEDSDGRGGR